MSMPLSMQRITIHDHKGWGKLIKSWATGRSYLGPGSQVPPIPQTIDELEATCVSLKIAIHVPQSVREKALKVIQDDENTVTLKLPPKALIEQADLQLEELGERAYPIPDCYNVAYGVPELRLHGMSLQDFHACRVGDYTISVCG